MPKTLDKVLITSDDYKVGKTVLAMAYTQVAKKTDRPDVLAINPDWGMDPYLVDTPEEANPEKLLFYLVRLPNPSLYEVEFLLERIKQPTARLNDLRVHRKPVVADMISDEVRSLSGEISRGDKKFGTIILDPMTRICEQQEHQTFQAKLEAKNFDERALEKVTMLTWAQVKDEIGGLMFRILGAQMNLIMTAWSKNKFDKETKRSTEELISDVLKNVRAFVDLELMLTPNPAQKGRTIPPKGIVMTSRAAGRYAHLPAGTVLPYCTWDTLLKAPKSE